MILTQIIKVTDENEDKKLEKKIALTERMLGVCLHISGKDTEVEVLTSADASKTTNLVVKEKVKCKKGEAHIINLSNALLFSELIIKVLKNHKDVTIKLCHGVK